MNPLIADIHIQYQPQEYISLDVDFDKTVLQLKEEIAGKFEDCYADQIEIVYNGKLLDDDLILSNVIKTIPTQTVHCFTKARKFVPHQQVKISEEILTSVQEMFNVIAHIQINVNSRVNILQKILSDFPEFRRNLAAQALIRDSVLFNTLHQADVIKNIAEHYPIIVHAAPSIVATVKKELMRSTSMNNSDATTDSTNSSEEENSLGASSSNDRSAMDSTSENARIRMISRQQLQAALAQIGVGSVNSLSNIAQRNTDSTSSGDRISSEQLRSDLQRAMDTINQGTQQQPQQQQPDVQQMDISETADNSMSNVHDASDNGTSDIPALYRTHQYAEQLRTMLQMGFIDYEENLAYLNLANGNIENAINLLMGAMN